MKIKAIIAQVGKIPYIGEIEDSFENYKEIVNGNIDAIPFPNDDNAVITFNREGKEKRLNASLLMPDYDDLLFGDYVITGNENDELISLTDEQVENCVNYITANKIEMTFEQATVAMREYRRKNHIVEAE